MSNGCIRGVDHGDGETDESASLVEPAEVRVGVGTQSVFPGGLSECLLPIERRAEGARFGGESPESERTERGVIVDWKTTRRVAHRPSLSAPVGWATFDSVVETAFVGETWPMFPVVLRFDGRLAVVIGGGTVADRKVSGLLDAGATVRVVAPMIVVGLRQRAAVSEEKVALVERPYDPADLAGAWYVVAATGDPVVQQAVADDCERWGIWCNAVDDPERCTVLLPAVHRSGEVIIAVSTSGSSPTLARILRDRIAGALPASLGEIARTLAERRRVWQAEGASTEDRNWAPEIDELLAEEIPRCPAFRNSSDQK